MATTVTSPSPYLAESLKGFREDIRVIPNAIKIGGYPYRPRDTVSPRIVWLRAFHRMYRPELAVKVVELLKREWPGTALTMVGPDKDGSLRRVREFAEASGVSGAVKLVPGVPHSRVREVLAGGDIFLNTATVDNTPVSVLEAMACGLCVVSTNVGGIAYLLEQEVDALLVRPGDPEAIAGAVRRILTEPGLAEHLSRNARKKAEAFDWSVVLPQWEELLLSASGKR